MVIDNEKQLLLISIQCWLQSVDRLMEWMQVSSAPRDLIAKARSGLRNDIKVHYQNPFLETLFPNTKSIVDQKIILLSKCAAQTKRFRIKTKEELITIQTPCDADLRGMKELVAGGVDNQRDRLQKIKTAVYQQFLNQLLVETQDISTVDWIDRFPWLVLCEAIRTNNASLVEMAFAQVPLDNEILRALLEAHSRDYLVNLIQTCATLKPDEYRELVPGDSDVVIGQHSFELFINDLITTLEQRREFNFSFGLPSHHAYRDKAAGFCLFNKTATLIGYEQLHASGVLHHVIVGMDVNRDNGLCEIIMGGSDDYICTHLDIYDSRVYPWQDTQYIEKAWNYPGTKENNMTTWHKGNRYYKSIDLADRILRRKGHKRHPVIDLIIAELETVLIMAKLNQELVILYLPTGWDSHNEETASPGQRINGKSWLTREQSMRCRFNDADWDYFNRQFFTLYERYAVNILRMYMQLEGGYTDEVNFKQVASLAGAMKECLGKLIATESAHPASSSSEPAEEATSQAATRNLRPRR